MTGSRGTGILFALTLLCLSEKPVPGRMETNMVKKKGLEPNMSRPNDDSIMELSLMMSRRQFDALERRARDEGMSVAQFLRRLVQESVADEVPVG